MNNKHIACVIVLILLLGLLQVTSWMNGRMVKMQGEAARASQAANSQRVDSTLDNQR